jgi:hypothetical protein
MMPEEATNPYAPPAAAEGPPVDGQWTVAAGKLLVRHEAALPPVDLTGKGGTDLTPAAFHFNAAHAMNSRQWLLLAIAFGAALAARWIFDGGEFLAGVLAVVVFSRLLGGNVAQAAARMTGFVSISAQQARARRARWRKLIGLAGLAAVVVPNVVLMAGMLTYRGSVAIENPLAWTFGWICTGLVLVAISVVWTKLDSGPVCEVVRDAWFHVKVPDPALEELARRMGETRPLRPRRVFTVFQHRLPFRQIARQVRNPWTLLILAILKARHSPRLERRAYTREEARRIEPAAADPGLRRMWDGQAAGSELAEWTPFRASWQDSPHRDFRTCVLMHASPDRTCFAMVAILRMGLGARVIEERELALRSWTRDGVCVLTSSHEMPVEQPAEIEFRRVKAPLAEMLRVHRERLAGRELRALDDAAFDAALAREIDVRQAAFEAAGVYGPAEWVELPEDW